tara:strand:- start:106 stop:447 length:342 start_codon:yes stop_codon:yes gene_type:complete
MGIKLFPGQGEFENEADALATIENALDHAEQGLYVRVFESGSWLAWQHEDGGYLVEFCHRDGGVEVVCAGMAEGTLDGEHKERALALLREESMYANYYPTSADLERRDDEETE